MRFGKALLAATLATMLSGAICTAQTVDPRPRKNPEPVTYVTISPVVWFGQGAVFLLKSSDGRMAAVSSFSQLKLAMKSMSEEPKP